MIVVGSTCPLLSTTNSAITPPGVAFAPNESGRRITSASFVVGCAARSTWSAVKTCTASTRRASSWEVTGFVFGRRGRRSPRRVQISTVPQAARPNGRLNSTGTVAELE